ncbi:ciliary microtubule-associated protein 2 [Amazona ochrocephala]
MAAMASVGTIPAALGDQSCQHGPQALLGSMGSQQTQKKGSEVVTVTVKSFLDELMSNENKTEGCFSTLLRDPGCPTERIFWFTLSKCPRKVNVMGPGSYNPKPIEKSACNSQAPSWSTDKRFNRNFYHVFTGNENPVGAGRCDTSKPEKYPQKIRYQSLYQCDAQRYLSNLKRDAYLLERLKPVAKTNWCDLISAPRCPDTAEEITFQKSDKLQRRVTDTASLLKDGLLALLAHCVEPLFSNDAT